MPEADIGPQVPECQRPFACVMLNGGQLLRCQLPTSVGAELRESAEAALPAPPGADALDGDFRVEAVFLSPNLVPLPNVQWHGRLLADGEHELDLGCIRTRRQHELTELLLPAPPASLTLTITAEAVDPAQRMVTAAERQLLDDVKSILEDPELNPRHGSMSSEQVQEHAQKSELYEQVLGETLTWAEFIGSHPETFTVFQYGEHEIKERGLSPFVSPDETRIVLKPEERQHTGGDASGADGGQPKVEQELREFLVEVLKERDYDQRELLQKIAERRDFSFYLAPAFSLLMRFLNRHRGTFQWTTDPGQPTRIGLCRGDRQVPAAQRRRSRQQQDRPPLPRQQPQPGVGFGAAPPVAPPLPQPLPPGCPPPWQMDGDGSGGWGALPGYGGTMPGALPAGGGGGFVGDGGQWGAPPQYRMPGAPGVGQLQSC